MCSSDLGGAKENQLADADGVKEVKAIDGSGDDGVAGMAHGGHGAGEVDEVHDFAAEDGAEAVGVVGKGEFGVFRNGVADWFTVVCHVIDGCRSGAVGFGFAAKVAGDIGASLDIEKRVGGA